MMEARDARRVSDELEAWFASEQQHTLGGLLEVFGKRSFAIAFVVLLGVPALPLPTGGVTHVFEVIAVLLGLELLVGRRQVWLPQRWCRLKLAPEGRFLRTLLRVIRRLERVSRPRLRRLFGHRLSNAVFGLLAVVLSVAAFVAPPFTGLDTLPALGLVVLSLGVLLEDFVVVAVGVAVGVTGIAVELVVGGAAYRGLDSLL
jgi:hypothetical protein